MKHAPKIGTRVRFPGNSVVGRCVGTVVAVYRTHIFPDDFDWDSDENPPILGDQPEEDWRVAIEIIGELPTPFVYHGTNRFAAEVRTIEEA